MLPHAHIGGIDHHQKITVGCECPARSCRHQRVDHCAVGVGPDAGLGFACDDIHGDVHLVNNELGAEVGQLHAGVVVGKAAAPNTHNE